MDVSIENQTPLTDYTILGTTNGLTLENGSKLPVRLQTLTKKQ